MRHECACQLDFKSRIMRWTMVAFHDLVRNIYSVCVEGGAKKGVAISACKVTVRVKGYSVCEGLRCV